MVCKNCGSDHVIAKMIEGFNVMECQVCEEIHGEPDIIKKVEDIREAKLESVDPVIYPLLKMMTNIPNFKIQFTCPGYPHEKVPPYLSFRIVQDKMKQLERFMEALLEANKHTKLHWVVEASFQRELIFNLKPEFNCDAYNISTEQICIAQKDLAILKEHISLFF